MNDFSQTGRTERTDEAGGLPQLAPDRPESRFRRILAAVKQEEEILSQMRDEEVTQSLTATRPNEAGGAVIPGEALPRTQPVPTSQDQAKQAPGLNGAIQGGGVATAVITSTQPDDLGDTRPVSVSRRKPAGGNQPPLIRDTDATQVSEAAYAMPGTGMVQQQPAYMGATQAGAGQTPARVSPGAKAAIKKKSTAQKRNWSGCLVQLLLVGMFVGAIMIIGGVTFLFFQYYQIASTLPNIGDLRNKAAQFETTRILDRNGNVLYEILDPNAGRRTYVTLDKISPYLVAATIATEDKAFYSHPGVDFWGIGRAFYQNYQAGGEIVSGASTITQQLARALLFSPEERGEQSYTRKIREAILATEITRRYSKDEILELYLNEIYYGNLAYGAQAAAETYFGANAGNLSLGQAAFLAGLPQAPSVYDVYTNPEAVTRRMEDVLTLMYQLSQEEGCIYVSNSEQRICLDPVAVLNAVNEIKGTRFEKRQVEMRFPHWVTYVRTLLESQYDPQTIYRSGFQVYTTIDPQIQEIAEQYVKEQVANLAPQRASNGALVAIKPSNGEILAMVGSADFYNEDIDGQVNMAVSPRQPGSAIKPLTYAAAFEKGWTPATLLWDVPTQFTPSGLADDPGPVYEPVNYDGRFHGPVTLRYALGNSYNIPAVKALQFVGVYDDPTTPIPDGFINFARRLGITTLNRDDYGLSLTLGGGDVSLLELTGAYAVFANNGRRIPPVAISKITDYNGQVVYEYRQPQGEQVLRTEHAYLISSILSDNRARQDMFGRNSVLRLPFDAAAKTGTTNDFRDNWTMGYTPDLAVGVWVGNADYSPMVNTTGLSGAAPIWSEFMQAVVPLVSGGNPTPFSPVGGIVEQIICAISGTMPSQWCPEQSREIFAADQPPLPPEEDLWQKPVIDTWTGLYASNACRDFIDDPLMLNVKDQAARRWIRRDPQGKAWAEEMGFEEPIQFSPTRECRPDDPRPTLQFISLRDGDTIRDTPLEIWAVADATDWFKQVRLEYGEGEDPVDWIPLEVINNPLKGPEMIYRWDLNEIPGGLITLRLYMESTEDTYAEVKVRLFLQVPTPTPTPTETPLPTPTPTFTPLPTLTPTPTPTDTPEPTPTVIIFPKATDTPVPTP